MAGYEKVDVWSLPNAPNPTTAKREVDEAVGASAFGFNVYEAAPGERVPWGRHRHPDHEELFFVLSGSLTVATPDGEYAVEEGEAFFVPADALNEAFVDESEQAACRFVAVGAPKDRDDAIIEEECPHCGAVTDRESERADETYVLRCAACGAETDRFSA
ncbi:cupin domain-containing protein [Halocalculus aciditolerans]|uniref:Cupin type-2 domain-containing protein n=1 Tax=Halocalculus aciditolerans TaxID=1383812 RepID=A0A830FLQ1_9EURY|nr:cupin domain-containing protein [Halocalculus aciditolerans]GGL58656.1 hypothetical protein GCM10009039_16130 [Halocalculus aciditolerans]